MKNATRGSASAVDTWGSGRVDYAPGDGQLVVIRPQVVESIGHVLGNLFQRVYHLIEQARAQHGASVDELENSTRQLETFLQLVLDYFSPLTLALDYVSAAEIAQSLARQVSDRIGVQVRIGAKLPVDARLLVDPGRLSRCFGLLATQLVENAQDPRGIDLQASVRSPGGPLTLGLTIPASFILPRSSASEMYWAVADKLLETHGGVLHERPLPSGDVAWEIVLPLQC